MWLYAIQLTQALREVNTVTMLSTSAKTLLHLLLFLVVWRPEQGRAVSFYEAVSKSNKSHEVVKV